MELTLEFQIPKTPLFQGKGPQVVQEELRAATEFGVLAMEQAILPLVPVDRGTLRGGVQTRVFGEGVNLVGRVFNPLAHALPLEHGARPHFPPLAPLQAWAARVLGVSGAEGRRVAFLVARAISRRGTKGHHFFERGFQQARPRVLARYQQALARIRARLAGGSGGAV
jgi:hypothetical protein